MPVPIPLLYSAAHIAHDPPIELWNGRPVTYPEMPERVENIKARLLASGLVTLVQHEETVGRQALTTVHDPDFLDYLEEISGTVDRYFRDPENFPKETGTPGQAYFFPGVFPIRASMQRIRQSRAGRHGSYGFDTGAPIGGGTWNAALHAASLALSAAARLLNHEADVVYALCRPPGHHAGPDFYGGYCYLNNAALAAQRLLDAGRVALLDVDYHHGNGTQTIFWDEPRVLFGSIHAHPDQEYPYYAGYEDEVGGDQARGTTINYPLPLHTDQETYLQTFDQLLAKTVDFQPAVVVVSLGFDTYKDDPIAHFNLEESGYEHMGRQLAALRLPLLLIQEGGYRLDALGPCAEAFLRGLNQERESASG